MIKIIILTVLFSISTVISILLLGSRSIVGNEMTLSRIFSMLFTWQFILGAGFAFGARMFFVILNSTLYKMPTLSASSTTVTTLITTASLIFVIIANYFFLKERLTLMQGVGSGVIILGVLLVSLK